MLFCGSGAAAPAAIVVGDCELAVATVRYGDSNAIGSTIEGSAFSGLFTRVEIGHIGIRSAGKGRISSPKCRRCRTGRHRCQIGDCLNLEIERVEATAPTTACSE
jgi:hypothetical protein